MSFRDLLKTLGEDRPPAMRYDGDDSPEGFRVWQEAFSAKLRELRGRPLPRPTPPAVEVIETVELADHVRQRVDIESVLGSKVPAYILIPKGLTGPRPGVMALHGHTKWGKERLSGSSSAEGETPGGVGLAAVRAGCVTICPDWWGWGDRAEPGFEDDRRDMCNVKFMAAGMYGVWLLSIMISDGRAALDVLAGRDDVDATRIAAAGNSFGGRMSMWLTAFDDRIAAAVCSGCLNCFRERSLILSSCGAQFFPGLLQYGDVQEVFATIAPRPLMITCGAQDALLPAEYLREMKPVIRRAYRILGAEENLNIHEHEGGHMLPAGAALDWLGRTFGM